MPNSTPFVSIIMPVYNGEHFLEEAIQSVLQQSLHELELILVNDGSIDSSHAICEKYEQQENRIVYLKQQNSGVSIARNNGLLHAKGKYIFFMDCDDSIDKNYIKSSHLLAEQNNSDIVILGEYYCKRMPNAPAFPTCAMFLRHSFLNQFPNVRFPEGIQPCEDGLFSHQLLALTSQISKNPTAAYFYRQHEHQNHVIIHTNNWKVIHKIPLWFSILEQFYNKHNLNHSHAMHLARFLKHEPFEFRYIEASLNTEQKKFLHHLICTFFSKNIEPHIKEQEKKELGKKFQYFLESKTHTDFDIYLQKHIRRRKKRKELYRFLIKFVPLRGVKRKLSKIIEKRFTQP